MYNFEAPANSLSFGHCALSILREKYNRDEKLNIFWIQNPPDFSAFDLETDFQYWLQSCAEKSLKTYSREDKGFKLWHIKDSEKSISNDQTLLTFHEVDTLTQTEKNILANQKKVLVSSQFSKRLFNEYGLKNVEYCPLGFDAHHFKALKRRDNGDKISFGLFGKFEKRKHTEKVIRAWVKRFGKNADFVLNLNVYNPFFKPEVNNQILVNIFGGQKPWNVECKGYVGTLIEYNAELNKNDIILDMSGGEGFSLPSFSAIAMGKHGVVHNCSSIKDWAEGSGAVLIEPNGKEPVYDEYFFREGAEFNQGKIFTWDEDEFIAGCEKAIENFKSNPINELGLTLQEKYPWSKTLEVIESNL